MDKCCKHCGTKENLVIQKYQDRFITYKICWPCRKKLTLHGLDSGRTPEARKKASQQLIGRKYTQEHCLAISKSKKGKPCSEAHREAMRLADIGRKQSPETIEKRVSKLRGKKHPPRPEGFSERVSKTVTQFYKDHPETIEKMSITRKEYYKNNPDAAKLISIQVKEFHKKHPEVGMQMSLSRKQFYKDHPEAIEAMRAISAKTCENMPRYGTSIELKMKAYLDSLGITYNQQKAFVNLYMPCNADFFLPEYNIVIECDGDYWHDYPYGTEKDKVRTKELEANGFKVLRFWERDINDNFDFVKEQIKYAINWS